MSQQDDSDAPHAAARTQPLLDQIAEVSQNARAAWFGLLGLLAFVGVILMGHEDPGFFASGAETRLPLIDITVPARTFFWVAPVLVAILYAYLNLYLLSLWEAIAEAPEEIGGQPLSDRVFPSLISQAAIVLRGHARPDLSSGRRTLQRATALFSATMIWLFGPAVLALLWWWSMPAHEEWMTLWIGLWLWIMCIVGVSTFRAAWHLLTEKSREVATRNTPPLAGSAALLLLAIVTLSWETTEGGMLRHTASGAPVIPLYPANLREAELVVKPDDWQPYGRWLRDFGKTYREENGIDTETELSPPYGHAFQTAAREEWFIRLNGLAGPDLRERDLRYADMRSGILIGADLRGARLDGADLAGAELHGVNLGCWQPAGGARRCASLMGTVLDEAKMQGVDLGRAQMQGAELFEALMQWANLRDARMQDAHLFGANMHNASLISAQMEGANLGSVQMQGANLIGASMQGANLGLAKMQGAELRSARLRGADLEGAELQGANLRLAEMERVNLRSVEMQGADLSSANLLDANCGGATFRGALLNSAQLLCYNLSQDGLEGAVGDLRTVLRRGLSVASCLETLPEEVEKGIAQRREVGDFLYRSRAHLRDALLCGEGEKPHATGSWPFERRYWDR